MQTRVTGPWLSAPGCAGSLFLRSPQSMAQPLTGGSKLWNPSSFPLLPEPLALLEAGSELNTSTKLNFSGDVNRMVLGLAGSDPCFPQSKSRPFWLFKQYSEHRSFPMLTQCHDQNFQEGAKPWCHHFCRSRWAACCSWPSGPPCAYVTPLLRGSPGLGGHPSTRGAQTLQVQHASGPRGLGGLCCPGWETKKPSF